MDLLQIDVALPRRAFELRAALALEAETVALVGPSGAGKSSLLLTVAGLARPRAGRIALGAEVWFDAARKLHLSPERRRVGYLPQDFGLFPHLTVAGNVRFAGKRERPELLERLGISHLAGVRPGELSGGERQRAALARALARDPRVLLLDEPFGALDTITRRRVRAELADLLDDLRLPTLLVTHSFEDAGHLARRIGVLDQGLMVQVGSAAELIDRPASALVAELTGANLLHGVAAPAPGGSTVELAGGGRIRSSHAASGPVTVAIHPSELSLCDPDASPLTDSVVSVRQGESGLLVRLTRMTVRAGSDGGPAAPSKGQIVGVRVAPHQVRLIPDGGHDGGTTRDHRR